MNCLEARSVSLKSNRRQMCLEEAESRSGNPARADGGGTQRRERASGTPPMLRRGSSCVILQLEPSVYVLGGDSKILEAVQQIAPADVRNTSARAATRSLGGRLCAPESRFVFFHSSFIVSLQRTQIDGDGHSDACTVNYNSITTELCTIGPCCTSAVLCGAAPSETWCHS